MAPLSKELMQIERMLKKAQDLKLQVANLDLVVMH